MLRRNIRLFVFLFMLAATYLVNMHVVYFGDDYWFSQYWGQNVLETFRRHYTAETGRILINIAGMLFTAAPELWKVISSVMTAAIVTLSGGIILRDERDMRKSVTVYAVLCASFLLLDADITRQSVYWIAGSVNYILPYLLFLLFWWALVRLKKRRGIILPLLAFFTGCSVEQAGLMTIGLCVLYALNDAVMLREKPRREHVLSLIAAVAGALTIYLAPATRLRFGLESAGDFESTGALVSYNFRFMLHYLTQSPYTLYMQVLILLSTGLFLYRQSRGFRGGAETAVKTLGLLAVPAAAGLIYMILGPGGGRLYTAFIWAMRAYYLVCVILVLYILLRRRPFEDYMLPVSAVILAGGSQLMMIISPAIGPRTTLCALLLAGFYSAYMLRDGVAGFGRGATMAGALALLLLSSMKFSESIKGYSRTERIHNVNEELIGEYGGAGALRQYKFTNIYCWSMPYQSPFHEECYKRHYGLPPDTEIVWEEYPAE